MSSSLKRANAPHGIGVPGVPSPTLKRATNGSPGHAPTGLVPGSGVRLGDTNTLVASAATSIRCPPPKAGPVRAPSDPLFVWHDTHDETLFARYAPRSTVAPAGLVARAPAAGLAGAIANAISAFPN